MKFNDLLPPIVYRALKDLHKRRRFRVAQSRVAAYDRLHLGSGAKVIEGWANLDLEGPAEVIVHDLTQPLPVASDSVRYIFTEHFIEHIPREDALRLLKECWRVLKANGVLRISTPDLKKLVSEYGLKRTSEWHDMGWMPATPCTMMNEGMRWWGHEFVYDLDELSGQLRAAGFERIEVVGWRVSKIAELCNLECRPYHEDLLIEAVK